MKVLKYTLPYIRLRIGLLIRYIGISLIVTVIAIFAPYLIGRMVNSFTIDGDLSSLYRYAAVLGVIYLMRLALDYVNSMTSTKLSLDLSYLVSKDIIGHVQNVPFLKTNEMNSVYLNQRVNQDAGSLISFSIFVITSVMTNIITIVAMTLLMFTISFRTTVFLSVFLLIYCGLFFLFKKPLYRIGLINKEAQNLYFSQMNEQFNHVKFVKIHSIKEFFRDRLENAFNKYRAIVIKATRLSNFSSGSDSAVMYAANIALYLFGGIEIINGNLTIGMFIVLSNYFPKLLGSSSYFFKLGKSYQDTLVSYDRLFEILNWEQEAEGSFMPKQINSIRVRKLSFGYNEKNVLDNLDFEFTTGKIYAVVGPNGIGKSTFIQALIGLFVNEIDGDILINGVHLKNCKMNEIRKIHIGVTEQEPGLLNDSITANIFLGENGNAEHLNNIAGILNMRTYINGLTDRLNTIITAGSSNLSGGEKQKISIARVLLRNPDIMIFDEPTSALDRDTAAQLAAHLNHIKQSKMIFIITHNSEIINICDEVIDLEASLLAAHL